MKSARRFITLDKFRKTDWAAWYFDRKFIYSNNFRIALLGGYYKLILKIKGVNFGTGLILNGKPSIRRTQDSKITIGNNCILNSAKNSTLIGLNKPCTLVTIKKNAEILLGNNTGATATIFVTASKIMIGSNVLIGANCTIIDNDFHSSDPSKRNLNDSPSRPIIIEDNVFIGFNCFILKGVTIGENSVIGANSVVISNIPKNSIAIGNPCKVIIRKNWDSIHDEKQ